MSKVVAHLILRNALFDTQLCDSITDEFRVHSCLTTFLLYILVKKVAALFQGSTLYFAKYSKILRYYSIHIRLLGFILVLFIK